MSNNSDEKRLTLSVHNLTTSSCSDGALCSLDPIDITLLPDPCGNISVGIRTEQNGQCEEGAVALDQLANAIGVCLGVSEIDTDVSEFTAIATSSTTATFSVIEDGVSRDVFISGQNIQFSGTGVDTDPFIITAQTSLSGDQGIDISGSGTSLDPFLFTLDLCEIPTVDALSVEAETESFIAMCIGGQNGKVRFSDFVSLPRFNTSVIAGANATVTGSGVPLDPYVVSSPDNTVVVAGSNTSVTGSGTPTSPYVVNAIIPSHPPFLWQLNSPSLIGIRDIPFDSGGTSNTVDVPIDLSLAPPDATHFEVYLDLTLRVSSVSTNAGNSSARISINGNTSPFRSLFLIDEPTRLTPQDTRYALYVDIPIDDNVSVGAPFNTMNMTVDLPVGHAGIVTLSGYLTGFKRKEVI